MELDRVHGCFEGWQGLKGRGEFVIPRLQRCLGLAFRLTVLVDSPEHHGKIVGVLQPRILAEKNRSSYLLGGGPLALCLEQPIATSCQSCRRGIPMLLARGLIATSPFPSGFDLGVVLREGLLAQGHTDFLSCLSDELLRMQAVLDLLRLREAGGRNLSHTRIEIAGDGLYRLS